MNVYHQGIQYVHMPLKMFSYTNIVFKNNKMRCLLPNKWSMRKFNNDWGTSNKCNKKKYKKGKRKFDEIHQDRLRDRHRDSL